MKKILDRAERYIIRLVVIGLVLMVIVQGVMTQDQYRMFLSWGERLEGESIQYPVSTAAEKSTSALEAVSPEAVIVISAEKYSSLPRTRIIVNGREKTTFEGHEVRLQLKAGDVIEIDTRSYNFPIEFQISDLSSNVAYPRKGQNWTVQQGLIMLGKVVVK